MTQVNAYHMPVRPYSPIDALNRRAAALGSPGYAAMTAYADYNGHHVTLNWNEYRGYYVAEYYWAGRVVIARGSFADCLRATLREHARGALGSSATIVPREDDADALALCRATPELVSGEMPRCSPPWHTWRHECAAASVRDYATPRALRMHFDWELMLASETRDAYESALVAKYGNAWT
jgi:hypothetical protein